MRREDLGFVVSRGLAVWGATLALRSLTTLLMLIAQVRQTPSTSEYALPRIFLATEAIGMAGEVALALLLWTKANSFGATRALEQTSGLLVIPVKGIAFGPVRRRSSLSPSHGAISCGRLQVIVDRRELGSVVGKGFAIWLMSLVIMSLPNFPQARSLLSAFGLYLFFGGLAEASSYYFIKDVEAIGYLRGRTGDWEGFVLEAAFGAVVYLCYTLRECLPKYAA